MKPQKEGIFIDGGSFNGDTIRRFIEWNGDFGYEKIIGFEPDKENYETCVKRLRKFSNVEILNEGLSDKRGMLSFRSDNDNPAGSYFSEGGKTKINVTDIDSYYNAGKISFIKLDVEGYELEALKGAKRVIQKHKPRMAVCVYHKEQDLLDCAGLLLKCRPDYQFYIRMYTNTYCETVLYAV